jgi:phosphatidylethanolamine-binding protein (PEBP) family uncharacterized protein
VPPGAQSLALLAESAGPGGTLEARWLLYDIPPDQDTLPEGFDPRAAGWGLPGQNAAGQAGYTGPCAPADGSRVAFTFRLLALASRPALPAGATPAELLTATSGQVLAQAELAGFYP